MKAFKPIRELNVFRHLSNDQKILVGQLAQNKQAVFFQYDMDYLSHFHSLSPFKLPFEHSLCQGPQIPHQGLHGVFSDSLPDGWGLLLMDRIFRQSGILPHQITPMDRLAYIGDRGIGALSYSPVSEYAQANQEDLTDISLLGGQAIQLFDGQTNEVLMSLANAGASGGARPKALIYFDPQKPQRVATTFHPGLQPWLIKFTSKSLLLGHEEGLCEAAYLTMASNAGINVPQWQLLEVAISNTSTKMNWLAMRRFDCPINSSNHARYHTHSLCGLLDADFRQPSTDYEYLIKASQSLCKSPAVGQVQFSRALFNLFSANQDDHSKNWSFLMSDDGQWQPSPFYDITYSPTPYNEHSTSFMGYGKQPPLKAIQHLARQANFTSWNEAKNEICRVVDCIQSWKSVAKELNVSQKTSQLIHSQLESIWKDNKHLLN